MRHTFVCSDPPFCECHASTIAEVRDGFVCAFFAGAKEGEPDVGIWIADRREDWWSGLREVATGRTDGGRRLPCWNPVLFGAPHGPLLLFYKVGPDPASWWGMLCRSEDAGRSWNVPRRLPDGIWGPIKNKPMLLEDGALLCPTSGEATGWQVYLQTTPDLGETWQTVGPLNDAAQIAAIQPTIIAFPSGRLQLLCRTRQGFISTCWSLDGGRSWSRMQPTLLPNPNSGIDACMLQDGRALLVYNHTGMVAGRWGGLRSPLNVAVSDDGAAWSAAALLENNPGEYSYPAVIQSSDADVHITYTWRRKNVRHVAFNPARLDPVPMPEGRWPKALATQADCEEQGPVGTDKPYRPANRLPAGS